MEEFDIFDLEQRTYEDKHLRLYHKDGIIEELYFKDPSEKLAMNAIIDNVERNIAHLVCAKKCVTLPKTANLRYRAFKEYKRLNKDYITEFRLNHDRSEMRNMYREMYFRFSREQKTYKNARNRYKILQDNKMKIAIYRHRGDILGSKLFINFRKALRPVEPNPYETNKSDNRQTDNS